MKHKTMKSMVRRMAALAMAAVCTFSLTQVNTVKAAEKPRGRRLCGADYIAQEQSADCCGK